MGQVDEAFYEKVLAAIHAPVTATTLHLCRAWQACEGGDAAHNPWNTTQPAPGASDYNSVGVKNYPDEETGVHATVVTLNNGYYPHILWAFQHQSVSTFGDAVDSSPWGTHGVAEYLSHNHAPEPSGAGDFHGKDILAMLPMLAHGAGLHNPDGNNHVRTVQALLNLHGAHVHVDGKFGDDTASAVRDFQSHAGVKSDGIVGPETYGKLLYVS